MMERRRGGSRGVTHKCLSPPSSPLFPFKFQTILILDAMFKLSLSHSKCSLKTQKYTRKVDKERITKERENGEPKFQYTANYGCVGKPVTVAHSSRGGPPLYSLVYIWGVGFLAGRKVDPTLTHGEGGPTLRYRGLSAIKGLMYGIWRIIEEPLEVV